MVNIVVYFDLKMDIFLVLNYVNTVSMVSRIIWIIKDQTMTLHDKLHNIDIRSRANMHYERYI